jgi:hypothetical protein
VLQIGLLNTGSASTENGWINILVPRGTNIGPCANEKGQNFLGFQPLQTSPESLRGTTSSEYLTAPMFLVEGMPSIAHYRLDFSSPGSYSVRIKLGAVRSSRSGQRRSSLRRNRRAASSGIPHSRGAFARTCGGSARSSNPSSGRGRTSCGRRRLAAGLRRSVARTWPKRPESRWLGNVAGWPETA